MLQLFHTDREQSLNPHEFVTEKVRWLRMERQVDCGNFQGSVALSPT